MSFREISLKKISDSSTNLRDGVNGAVIMAYYLDSKDCDDTIVTLHLRAATREGRYESGMRIINAGLRQAKERKEAIDQFYKKHPVFDEINRLAGSVSAYSLSDKSLEILGKKITPIQPGHLVEDTEDWLKARAALLGANALLDLSKPTIQTRYQNGLLRRIFLLRPKFEIYNTVVASGIPAVIE